MNPPKTRHSESWTRAGIAPRFQKITDKPTLGGGIIAQVVKGWDSERDCYVAVKKSRNSRQPQCSDLRLNSIAREYTVLKTLDHPNILRPLAHGRDRQARERDRAYLVTEWVPGKALADCGLGAQPLQVILGVLSGLAHMHGRKTLHGDLHAANILRVGARAVIIDLGMAQRLGDPHGDPQTTHESDVQSALDAMAESTKDPEAQLALELFAGSALAAAWRAGDPPDDSALRAWARSPGRWKAFSGPVPRTAAKARSSSSSCSDSPALLGAGAP